MAQALMNGILNFFLFLIKVVGTIFIYPLQAIFVTLVPSVGDFLSDILGFFTGSIFPMMAFLKNMMLNITCCPPVLFTLLVGSFFGFLTIALSLRVFMLIYRVYMLVRGAKG